MAEIRKRQAARVILYKKEKKRRWWIRPWLARRIAMAVYRNLMQEMTVEDTQQFQMFTRTSASNLEDILSLVGTIIAKTDANMREAICAKERMAVTSDFLLQVCFYCTKLQNDFAVSVILLSTQLATRLN